MRRTLPPELPDIFEIVKRALAEDVGTGDITSQLTVPESAVAVASMRSRADGVVAGLPVASAVFMQVDPSVVVESLTSDGQRIAPGETLLTITGPARGILSAERVALNFVQRLSGIATYTSALVDLAGDTRARVVDTRKTTPGIRALEKYAVRVGGGHNHRFGLSDAVMIKDNHIAVAGGITAAVEAAFAGAPHTMTVTVECDSIAQVEEAIEAGADIVLLDNMSVSQIAAAVELVNGQAAVEASGGITSETIGAIAAAGVDVISVGALTHSVSALDIGLDIERLVGDRASMARTGRVVEIVR